ncbi:glycosyltransferase [Gordonibacter sp. 28C]|uniref:glycosyltransferase family 2 protein n=1 Tax=Gordonibacter sp. 28C TaxID=2078569 RepID=UPI001314EEEE|nr:glycosyltransferase [Gordonibacter sp. 28C]
MDISVIIPVYNAAAYLHQCLSSIVRSFVDVEILCINDGSTDKSLAIMRAAATHDERITVIDKPNEGYGATLNKGIAEAHGKYIAILEPDDYLEGDMFSSLFGLAEREGFPDVVKSAYQSIGNANDDQGAHCGYWKRIKPPNQPFCIEDAPLLLRYHPSIWSAIYRRDFLVENGIRFKEVPGAGWVDNPFLMETLLKAKSISYTDNSFYRYRDEREGSSSSSLGDFRIPLDRWNEMTDTVEQLNIQNATILGIQAYRAFYYLKEAHRATNFDEKGWLDEAKRIMRRLKPEIIAQSPFVSPRDRALYKQLTGAHLKNPSNIPYYNMVVREAFWKVRQNGIGFLIKSMSRRNEANRKQRS